MNNCKSSFGRAKATATLALLATAMTVTIAQAQYTGVWYDSFNVSYGTNKVSFEYNNGTRQGGVLSPIGYSQSPSGGDYHHQVIGNPGPLVLAGDAPSSLIVGQVSPQYNFKSLVAGGVPKRISFSMDLNATTSGQYTWGGISLGASAVLTGVGSGGNNLDATASHFGVQFIEDGAFGNGNFIQFYDGSSLVGNLIPFAAGGAGIFNVALTIDDPADGNPWDGVGSSVIDLYVNGNSIASYTKGGGGYTDNYMTLAGGWGYSNGTGFTLATTTFDDLLVEVAAIPEPSVCALIGLGLAGSLIFRRRKA